MILFLEALLMIAARGKHRGLGWGVVSGWHVRALEAGWVSTAPGYRELTWEFWARHVQRSVPIPVELNDR